MLHILRYPLKTLEEPPPESGVTVSWRPNARDPQHRLAVRGGDGAGLDTETATSIMDRPSPTDRNVEAPAMTEIHDARLLQTSALLARARHERTLYGQASYDPRFEWELFRRAVMLRAEHRWVSEQAWEALTELYGRMARAWICNYRFRDQSIDAGDNEADALLNAMWGRFYRYYTPEKMQAAPDLGSILAYMRRCAHAVTHRELAHADRIRAKPDEVLDLVPSPDGEWELEPGAGALWTAIRKCITDDDESLVAIRSWVEDEAPRAIALAYPDRFPNAEAVSTIKERILRRIKRDPTIRRLLDPSDEASH